MAKNGLPIVGERDFDCVDARYKDTPYYDLPAQSEAGEAAKKYRVLDDVYDASLDLNREKYLRRRHKTGSSYKG